MSPILAYLDPVTGNALLQVLLAAAAAIGLGYQYIRRFFNNLVSRFSRKDAPEPEEAPTTPIG